MGIPEQRQDFHRQPFAIAQLVQLALDVVERELRHLEQHQPTGPEAQDLAAQLRTDRAARARHHHALVTDAGLEQLRIRWHCVATQQIADVDVVQLVDARLAGDDVREVRQRLDVNAQRLERREYLATAAARSRRHGEQDALDAVLMSQRRQLTWIPYAKP